jgi:hypothetical protein
MDAAQTIRDAVAQVAQMRNDALADVNLYAATVAIKSLQARRFAGTYADLLASKEYGRASRFFLEDLYSDKDYSLRDAQFARIAGGLQRLFPQQVVATAVALARLHVLTENLDRRMAEVWMNLGPTMGTEEISRYVSCWTTVDREHDREDQLEMVINIGFELDRLTRIPGLRLMLKMMRRPAQAAGIGSLQTFLESGFDIFASMSGKGSGAQFFLTTIRDRETHWVKQLSGQDKSTTESRLRACLESIF